MKLVKQLFFIAMLLGSVAVVLTSCDDGGFGGGSSGGGGSIGGGGSSGGGGGGGSSGGGGSGFVMDEAQLAHYTGFINGLVISAAFVDLDGNTVRRQVDAGNVGATVVGYKIKDRLEGSPIRKGTKAASLKVRFVPTKL